MEWKSENSFVDNAISSDFFVCSVLVTMTSLLLSLLNKILWSCSALFITIVINDVGVKLKTAVKVLLFVLDEFFH